MYAYTGLRNQEALMVRVECLDTAMERAAHGDTKEKAKRNCVST